MVQKNVKVEESTEVETVEASESIPEVKVEKEVDVGKMRGSLSWAPLENEKLEIHAEEILTGILSRVQNLSVKTSPNQHQAIYHSGEGGTSRGRVVAKAWFSKKKIVLETARLDGKVYVPLNSRTLDEKIGLSKKNRSKAISEIKGYIKARGWEK